MPHPFEGVVEKLKRANESIRNLKREITAFFKDGLYSVIRNQDDESLQKALDYHSRRVIPPRFSVLIGEIVHHFRSSLDHMIWEVSDPAKRVAAENVIKFPIYKSKPATKEEIARFNRKIDSAPASIQTLVKQLQPYQPGNPVGESLLVIHNMDRFDKHRELSLVILAFNLRMGRDTLREFMAEKQAHSQRTLGDFIRAMKMDSQITPQIAFPKVGQRKNQPVIPTLSQFGQVVSQIVKIFVGVLGQNP